jgi:hypothetical protein
MMIAGPKLSFLSLWKCPSIKDLSAMELGINLKDLEIFWNQKATRLWNFECNPKLTGLDLSDFRRLEILEDLVSAKGLKRLYLGDRIWSKMVLESLKPLVFLPELEELSISIRKLTDGDVFPLTKIPNLKTLDCPANLFTKEQCAWLRARLGLSVESWILRPTHTFDHLIGDKDVLVMGKKGRFLNSVADKVRIEKAIEEYYLLVKIFEDDPTLMPDQV